MFNNKPEVVLPFTSDGAKILQALTRAPTLAYGTHMYDAVSESISLLADAKIAAGSVRRPFGWRGHRQPGDRSRRSPPLRQSRTFGYSPSGCAPRTSTNPR